MTTEEKITPRRPRITPRQIRRGIEHLKQWAVVQREEEKKWEETAKELHILQGHYGFCPQKRACEHESVRAEYRIGCKERQAERKRERMEAIQTKVEAKRRKTLRAISRISSIWVGINVASIIVSFAKGAEAGL